MTLQSQTKRDDPACDARQQNGVPTRTHIAVFVHVFHPEVWAEMVKTIDTAIDRPFHLVVTCPHPNMDLARSQSPHLVSETQLITENRGRDVLPFLTALRSINWDFEIGLKLHTKRSTHRKDGNVWRNFLVTSLLRRNGETIAALDLMDAIPLIGLIAPRYHLLPLTNRLIQNRRNLKAIMAATGCVIPLAKLEQKSFAAGTMFWFRKAAIAPLAECDLTSCFVPEKGQIDGTAAHAVERLFAHVAENQGFLATADEAVDALRAVCGTSLNDLQALNASLLNGAANPFLMEGRAFWKSHPRLFEIYATLKNLAVG